MLDEFSLSDEFIKTHRTGSGREWADVPWLTEVTDYNGGDNVCINATQLGFHEVNGEQKLYTEHEKRKIVQKWCEFLSSNPTQFRRLYFRTRVPQDLFNAACQQLNLETLHVKWGPYTDISSLSNLKKLRVLYLGSGAAIKSIDVLGELKSIRALQIENFQKIEDFSILGRLTNLEMLEIFPRPLQLIHISNLKFLESMTSLRHLWIAAAIRDGSITTDSNFSIS